MYLTPCPVHTWDSCNFVTNHLLPLHSNVDKLGLGFDFRVRMTVAAARVECRWGIFSGSVVASGPPLQLYI